MLTYEGHTTLQFSGKEEELVATDCVKRRNVTHEETPVQGCSFLVPRVRSVEDAGPSQQQVNCWRHRKMNNSSWIHSKAESTGQTAAPQMRERMVRVQTQELDTLGSEPRRKTWLSFMANLLEALCGQVWESNTPGRSNNRGVPTILWDLAPGVQLCCYIRHLRKIPLCFHRGPGKGTTLKYPEDCSS